MHRHCKNIWSALMTGTRQSASNKKKYCCTFCYTVCSRPRHFSGNFFNAQRRHLGSSYPSLHNLLRFFPGRRRPLNAEEGHAEQTCSAQVSGKPAPRRTGGRYRVSIFSRRISSVGPLLVSPHQTASERQRLHAVDAVISQAIFVSEPWEDFFGKTAEVTIVQHSSEISFLLLWTEALTCNMSLNTQFSNYMFSWQVY